MDLMVLNKKFETVHVIDAYRSLIWTDRFYEAGDFELYTEVSGEIFKYVEKDFYVTIKESPRTMIVSGIQTLTNVDVGKYIAITGKSLEKILDRRIVWGQRELNTSFQNGIKTLLMENIISPSDPNRRIDNFIFEESSDPKITSLTMNTQFTGDNLYDVVYDECQERDLGFRIVLNNDNQFVFSLYAGKDRSYNQSENPFVIFSPRYENLINSEYYTDNSDMKNITLIGGQGEGSERVYTTYGSGSGLDRRELFTDARDLSPDGITSDQYNANLQSRGKQKLSEHTDLVLFEGDVEPVNSYIYQEDYDLGDIVEVENEYGITGTSRITEVIACQNESGYSITPTFDMIGIDENTEGGD